MTSASLAPRIARSNGYLHRNDSTAVASLRFAPWKNTLSGVELKLAAVGCGGWGDPRAGEQSRRQRANSSTSGESVPPQLVGLRGCFTTLRTGAAVRPPGEPMPPRTTMTHDGWCEPARSASVLLLRWTCHRRGPLDPREDVFTVRRGGARILPCQQDNPRHQAERDLHGRHHPTAPLQWP